MKKIDWKKLLPHIIALAIFTVLTYTYFSPVLEGYTLKQGDIVSHKGMAKEIVDFREIYQEEPLWTNSMFGGMPAYQISTYYTSNFVKVIDKLVKLIISGAFGNFLWCFISFYILLISFKVKPILSSVGATAYAFTSYNLIILEAGHNSKLHAIALIPGVIAGVYLILKENKLLLGGVITSIFVSLEVMANHYQITYYFLFVMLFIGLGYLFQAIRDKEYLKFSKQVGVLFLAGSIGVLTNFSSLYNTALYAKDSTRGMSELTITPNGEKNIQKTSGLDLDYMTQWSYGIGETWSLIIPNIKGGATSRAELPSGQPINSYFGNQPFTSGPVYFGALVCTLFLLAIVFWKNWIKWPLLAVSIMMLILSWGNNMMGFTEFFANTIPFYNKFRTVSMTLVVLQFIFPFVGILFINDIFKNKEVYKPELKKMLITSGVFSGVILLIGLTPSSFFDLMSVNESNQINEMLGQNPNNPQIANYISELETYRSGLISNDAFRSFMIILIGIGAIFLFLKNDKIKGQYVAVLIGLITLIDLWSVDKRYLNNEKDFSGYVSWQKKEDARGVIPVSPADLAIYNIEAQLNSLIVDKSITDIDSLARIKKEKGLLGVKEWEQNALKFKNLNFSTNYRVFNLATDTYNDSKTSYFHKSVGGYSAVKMSRYQDLIDFHLRKEVNKLRQTSSFAELGVLNMLNTKYLIYDPSKEPLVNPFSMGNAWFVNKLSFVNSANDEILKLNEIDPKNELVADAKFNSIITEPISSNGTIELLKYLPNHLIYSYETKDDNNLAVFSEIYYDKGWNAYVDGNLEPHARVNYLLRGMNLPKGKHTLEFKFEPKSFSLGNKIGVVASIIIILSVLVLAIVEVKKKKA